MKIYPLGRSISGDLLSHQEERGIRPPGPDQKLGIHHFIQYFLLLMLQLKANVLPLSLVRKFGRFIGWLFYLVDKNHRKIALLNLDQAYGDTITEAEKQKIMKNCFYHFGVAIMETLASRKITAMNFPKFVELKGVDGFKQGLAQGNGVILCSAHYGNWEIMNLVLGYLRFPMSAMARPIDNPLVHKFLEKIRTRPGNQVIYKHKSVRKIFSALKENRVIGIVNDQDVHDRNRIMTQFFGREAATTPVPAAVAYKTGAPIITGYAQPMPDGKYLLTFGELIYANQEANKDEEIMRVTELLNRRLEEQIKQYPDCWMWLHKRFKTGTDGLTGFYDGPREAK